MLASDLQGLGVSPLLAAKTATGGVGPIVINTITNTVSSFASALRLGCNQFLVAILSCASGGGVTLPLVGTDNGCSLTDDFIVNNQGTSTIFVFASTGVLISVGGQNTNFAQVNLHTTMTLYPITTTQWIGVKGS